MLGDGMVIFGIAVLTAPARNRKSSAKIGSSRCSGLRTASPAAMNWPMPSSLRNCAAQFVGADDAAQLVDEVHVPGVAAELPVGRRAEAEVLLEGDDLADGVVFSRAEAVGVDATGREVVTGLYEVSGAQQATDVLGPEWRLGAGFHGRST